MRSRITKIDQGFIFREYYQVSAPVDMVCHFRKINRRQKSARIARNNRRLDKKDLMEVLQQIRDMSRDTNDYQRKMLLLHEYESLVRDYNDKNPGDQFHGKKWQNRMKINVTRALLQKTGENTINVGISYDPDVDGTDSMYSYEMSDYCLDYQ